MTLHTVFLYIVVTHHLFYVTRGELGGSNTCSKKSEVALIISV